MTDYWVKDAGRAPPSVVTGSDLVDEWRRWFRDSGLASFWDNVECIECEIGRECLKEPPCEGAISEDDS